MDIYKDPREIYKIHDCIVSDDGKEYEVQEYIGSGGNAAVYGCIDDYGNEYAVKFLLSFNQKSNSRFDQEIKVLKEINHNHIIKYYGNGSTSIINTKNSMRFLIMEKADDNLNSYIKKKKLITYDEYAPQFRGLSSALGILHEKVLHRDIKPENILVKGGRWLISDFGLCTYIKDDEHVELTSHYEKVGPKYWMSPEAINNVLNHTDQIDTYSDVFQLGAVFWYIVTNRYPLGNVSIEEWNNNDDNIFNVIIKALSHDANKRQKDGKELYQEMYAATIERK